MSFQDFENAVHSEVMAALGYAASKVIWENQNGDRPLRPFVSLQTQSIEPLSPHFENSVTDNPTPSAGEEILVISKSQYRIDVQCTVFSSSAVGTSGALYLANRIYRHFGKDDTLTRLEDGTEPISVVRGSPAQDVSIVLDAKIEGRATLVLSFYLAMQDEEATTYIETVEQSYDITPFT